jgi:hypothetical protein
LLLRGFFEARRSFRRYSIESYRGIRFVVNIVNSCRIDLCSWTFASSWRMGGQAVDNEQIKEDVVTASQVLHEQGIAAAFGHGVSVVAKDVRRMCVLTMEWREAASYQLRAMSTSKPCYFTMAELAVIHPRVSSEEVSNRAWKYFSRRAKQPNLYIRRRNDGTESCNAPPSGDRERKFSRPDRRDLPESSW